MIGIVNYSGCAVALYRSSFTLASRKAVDALSVTPFPATVADRRASMIATTVLDSHQ